MKLVPLKRAATINARVLAEATDPDREIRYIDIATAGTGRLVSEPQPMTFAAAPSRARRLVSDGDTIVSTVRTYLRAVWPVQGVTDDLVVSTGFAVLTPSPSLDARFLGWTAQSSVFIEEVVARSVGVSYPAIGPRDLGEIAIPVPPLSEQRAIAEYLDTETARIDALMGRKRRMLGLVSEWAASARSRAFSRPASPPQPLKRFASKIGSGKTPRGGSESYASSGVLFLRSQNVQNGFLDTRDAVFIDSATDAEMATTRARAGDVVLNITGGSIGRCSVVTEAVLPANVSQHVCIVRPLPGVDPIVLHHALRASEAQDAISLLQVGGNREGLNFEQVGRLPVRLPTTPTDFTSLARELAGIESTASGLVAAITRQISLLSEHRQALITAAVTGELAVPGVAA